MTEVSAFVLAGGRSSRMGRDKAFLEWRGQTLLGRALELARTVTERVSIVGQREKFAAFAPVVEDIYPGQGPLAGIHAALSSSPSELNLLLAVDTPLVTPEFLVYLAAQAKTSGAVVTAARVPRTAGGPPPARNSTTDRGREDSGATKLQPLCAMYRREFAAVAAAALRAQRNKIEPLFTSIPKRIIEPEELVQLAFDLRMFDNLNTPEEWEQARSR